ncbi:lipase [Lithospermum erythrorhizon]|uniref:Lipase n=1 Tax=Lithospermum erythrorhizon TaxID=34254 RepID=A0AAV3QQ95_LITER
MQRIVDNVLAVTKESVKTFTYESLNNIVRFINGFSALLLSILPGKSSILEGIHGWELRPSFRGPRLPRWMEDGVSSFNRLIHELSVDTDTSSPDYTSAEEYDDDIIPLSPSSQSSRASDSSSFRMHDSGWRPVIRYIISWMLFPVTFLLGIPILLYTFASRRVSPTTSSTGTSEPSHRRTSKRIQTLKDDVVQFATDRRRGVIEDLHLAIEISIESAFDVVQKATNCIVTPFETIRKVLKWVSSHPDGRVEYSGDDPSASVPTATLSDSDPTPQERKTTVYHSLNTDARTCRDVITELGYPYEAIRVVTSDGYVLLLERIPRRDSRKVVYLQHGILDSSMGWVSNGVVGSPAFAAFDQGCDVYLGNFRGLISREHVNKNISSRQYWRYSINEHGMEDIPAMIEKIHEVKNSELKADQPSAEEEPKEQPYRLCAVCHSLGGAAILMYIITRRIEEKPHRLSRLILLSPAGFHQDSTFVFTSIGFIFRLSAPLVAPLFPAFYIPTRFFRMLLNKLARDFHNLPAVGGLVQTLMSYVVGGDSSNWVGVIGIPHYNMNDMPGVSFRVALHLAQMKHSRKFMMFDYGSAAANMEVYGSREPLDLGEYYGFIDIPVDLVAGHKDKVIRPSMVRKHYQVMKESGVEVSYNEFEYAHLDFTFSHREELLAYVMSRLRLMGSSLKQQHAQKATRGKRHTV